MERAAAEKKFLGRPGLVNAAVLVLLTVLAFAAYYPSLHGPFTFDDTTNIELNSFVRIKSLDMDSLAKAAVTARSPHRQVANVSFALNYYVTGMSPAGFRVVNILIHVLCGFALFIFLKTTLSIPGRDRESALAAAFFAALLWTLHPLNTQSVAYVVQRMNSLAVLFYISALTGYAKGRLEGKGSRAALWYLGAAVSAGLAVFTKEIALTLPLMVLFYEWCFFRDFSFRWLARGWVYILGGLALCLLVALYYVDFSPFHLISSTYASRDFTASERILTQFRIFWQYLSLLAFPAPGRLALLHDVPMSRSLLEPPATLAAILGVAALAGAAIALARKKPLVTFAVGWLFLGLAVESSAVGLEPMFEHRLYLPSMMPVLLFVLGVMALLKNRKAQVAVFSVLAAALFLATAYRNQAWGDGVILWEKNREMAPGEPRVYSQLGYAYLVKEEPEKAAEAYETAVAMAGERYRQTLEKAREALARGRVKEALALYERLLFRRAHYVIFLKGQAAASMASGRLDPAETLYREALALAPFDYEADANLARVLFKKGNLAEAGEFFARADATAPDRADIVSGYAEVLAARGELARAEELYRRAVELEPDTPTYREGLGRLLFAMGKRDEAMESFQAALRLDPRHKGTLKALDEARKIEKAEEGMDQAIAEARRAIKARPDVPALHDRLGSLYKARGRRDLALESYKKAEALAPDSPEIKNNLGLLFMESGDAARAREYFLQALERKPGYVLTLYNLTCLYSKAGDTAEAGVWFKKLLDAGFHDFSILDGDADLANLRRTPLYREMREKYAGSQKG